jgi:hypothetical protein
VRFRPFSRGCKLCELPERKVTYVPGMDPSQRLLIRLRPEHGRGASARFRRHLVRVERSVGKVAPQVGLEPIRLRNAFACPGRTRRFGEISPKLAEEVPDEPQASEGAQPSG